MNSNKVKKEADFSFTGLLFPPGLDFPFPWFSSLYKGFFKSLLSTIHDCLFIFKTNKMEALPGRPVDLGGV